MHLGGRGGDPKIVAACDVRTKPGGRNERRDEYSWSAGRQRKPNEVDDETGTGPQKDGVRRALYPTSGSGRANRMYAVTSLVGPRTGAH